MQDPPQQEYAWAMRRVCDATCNTWFMDKVEAEGRSTIRGAASSVPSPNLPTSTVCGINSRLSPIPNEPRPRKSSVARARFQASSWVAAAALPGELGQGRSYCSWIKFPARKYPQCDLPPPFPHIETNIDPPAGGISFAGGKGQMPMPVVNSDRVGPLLTHRVRLY